jgi:hypothetical protein
MLTPGEFVVNAADTAKNFGLLQAINSGHQYQPAPVALSSVSGPAAGSGSSVTNTFNIMEQSSPVATAHAVARRQNALAS